MTNDGDFVIFEGNSYRRGFLYKSFPMNAIVSSSLARFSALAAAFSLLPDCGWCEADPGRIGTFSRHQ